MRRGRLWFLTMERLSGAHVRVWSKCNYTRSIKPIRTSSSSSSYYPGTRKKTNYNSNRWPASLVCNLHKWGSENNGVFVSADLFAEGLFGATRDDRRDGHKTKRCAVSVSLLYIIFNYQVYPVLCEELPRRRRGGWEDMPTSSRSKNIIRTRAVVVRHHRARTRSLGKYKSSTFIRWSEHTYFTSVTTASLALYPYLLATKAQKENIGLLSRR